MPIFNKKISLSKISLTLVIIGTFFAFVADKFPLVTPICMFLFAAIEFLQGFIIYHKERKSSYIHFVIAILVTINNIRVFIL